MPSKIILKPMRWMRERDWLAETREKGADVRELQASSGEMESGHSQVWSLESWREVWHLQ